MTKQQKTSIGAIVLIVIAALFGSIGQIFYKLAANNLHDVASFILNPYVYIGGLTYGVGLLFMLKALKHGELNVLYPMMATSFIWVSILSPIFFSTDIMSIRKWAGIVVILLGVALITKGRAK